MSVMKQRIGGGRGGIPELDNVNVHNMKVPNKLEQYPRFKTMIL